MINPQSMTTPTSSSQTLTAGAATMATTFLCKYLQLDMMQYGIVYGLMIAMLQYIANINTMELKKEIRESFYSIMPSGIATYIWIFIDYYYIWIPVIALIAIVASFKYIKEAYLNYMAVSKSEYSFEFCSSDKVDQVLRYLQSCPEVLGFKYNASCGNEDLEFLFRKRHADVNRGQEGRSTINYLEEHRDIFLPLAGKVIKYNDPEIGINGTVLINKTLKTYTVIVGSGDKAKDEEKTIFLLSIQFNIESNDNQYNISQFYDEMIARDEKTREINITALVHKKMVKAIDDDKKVVMEPIYDIYYRAATQSFEKLEKVYIDPFFHPQKDRLWGLIKTISLNPNKMYKFGQVPRGNFLLHGPPGTGKSSFPYRVAVVMKYNFFSVDIRNYDTKYELDRVFNGNPFTHCRSGYGSSSTAGVVHMLDEFDLGIRFLYKLDQASKREIDHVENQIDYTYKLLENSKVNYSSFLNGEFEKKEREALAEKNKDSKEESKEKKNEDSKSDKEDSNDNSKKANDDSKDNSKKDSKKVYNDNSKEDSKPDEEDSKDNSKKDSKDNSKKDSKDNSKKDSSKNSKKSDKKNSKSRKYVELSDSRDDFYSDSSSYEYDSEGYELKKPKKKKDEKQVITAERLNLMLGYATDKAKRIAKEKSDICLKDLLTIFQGPVPKIGSLIFATTNDYDEIYQMCPALFRHSR